MKLPTLINYLLSEAKAPSKVPAKPIKKAPDSGATDVPKGKPAPYGKFLFGKQRVDGTPGTEYDAREQNTPEEDEIFSNLIGHYGGPENTGTDPEDIVQSILNLKAVKNSYPKLLVPPSGKAYRFVKDLRPEEASEWYLGGLPIEKIVSQPNKAFYVSNPVTVNRPARSSTTNPNSIISSWTINPNSGHFSDFASHFNDRDSVTLLLVADIGSNDFIMNPDNLTKTMPHGFISQAMQKEHEVIAYGPVKTIGATIFYIANAPTALELPRSIVEDAPSLGIKSFSKPLSSTVFIKSIKYIDSILQKSSKVMVSIGVKIENGVKELKERPLYEFLFHCSQNGFDFDDEEGVDFLRQYCQDEEKNFKIASVRAGNKKEIEKALLIFNDMTKNFARQIYRYIQYYANPKTKAERFGSEHVEKQLAMTATATLDKKPPARRRKV
jgi:hypothetical protein